MFLRYPCDIRAISEGHEPDARVINIKLNIHHCWLVKEAKQVTSGEAKTT